jgi:hypothetical protein
METRTEEASDKSVARVAIIEERIALGDPFYYFIRYRLGFTPLSIFLAVSLIPLTFESVLCALNACLVNQGGQVGLWNDYLNFYNFLVFFPVSLSYYLWFPTAADDVFSALKKLGVIPHLPSTKIVKKLPPQSLPIITGVLAILITIFAVVPGTENYVTYWRQFTSTYYLHQIAAALVIYVTLIMVVRIAVLVRLLNTAFRRSQVNLKALHPDGSGGLGALGKLSVRTSYLIAIIGVDIVLSMILQPYLLGEGLGQFEVYFTLVLFLAIYLIVAPIAFFAPLATAHSAMKKAREDELLEISRRFEHEYETLKRQLSKKDEDVAPTLERIDQLKKVHQIVDDFPVWPLNTDTLLRFAGSVVLPFVLTIVSAVIGSFLGG